MFALENKTPFAANYVVLPNRQGVDTLVVNVQASFQLGRDWTLSAEQKEPFYEDIYWGKPGRSSLKYPSSVHLGKPSTDIAVLGHACAPDNKPVRQLDVIATIGSIKKILSVFGDRVWDDGRISTPAEFVQLPIIYENAYGGELWCNNNLVSIESRNPVGKGFRGSRHITEMDGLALPNIESPNALIVHLDDSPPPAGFGFIPANWHPRALYAGTYDEHWQKNRAPYLPQDYQSRFEQSAHPDMISPAHLTGGELVTLTNMHPGGIIKFMLPTIQLRGSVHFLRALERSLEFVMETLIIDVDNYQIIMSWKAVCLCNNDLPLLKKINIHLSR